MTEYKEGSNLCDICEYGAGDIVTGVPVRYFDDDVDAMDYRKKHRRTKFWRENVANIAANWDPDKLTPLYYCLQCCRLEDGAHRLFVADKLEIEKMDVRIGDVCYKQYRKTSDAAIMKICLGVMDEIPTTHKLDRRWLIANATDKWNYLSGIDFKDKSFLDIGCHVGFSCFEAWRRGAASVLGMDIREDVLAVAEEAKRVIGIGDPVQFINQSWTPNTHVNADVVMMSGLIHYFSKKDYTRVLKRACEACSDTLILELRIIPYHVPELRTMGKQTIPTTAWLSGRLVPAGFECERFVRGKHRELWVCNRVEDTQK